MRRHCQRAPAPARSGHQTAPRECTNTPEAAGKPQGQLLIGLVDGPVQCGSDLVLGGVKLRQPRLLAGALKVRRGSFNQGENSYQQFIVHETASPAGYMVLKKALNQLQHAYD